MVERPYVTVSFAQSLDGRIATAQGDSQWIGGSESMQLAHELRRDNDAILVGISTVLRDNPKLTCRIPGGRNPIRIVLDRTLRITVRSQLVETIAEAPVWIFHSSEAQFEKRQILISLGIKLFEIPLDGVDLDLLKVLEVLNREGVKTLFVEGGSRVITSFLRCSLVDRWIAVTAPLLLGKGTEAVGDLGTPSLREALRPRRWKYWQLGDDFAAELIFREKDF